MPEPRNFLDEVIQTMYHMQAAMNQMSNDLVRMGQALQLLAKEIDKARKGEHSGLHSSGEENEATPGEGSDGNQAISPPGDEPSTPACDEG